ncbi:hypothetical protein DDZ13_05505 [Coraliomargarita sinensis]|uniref:Uncharacterized protein n=1 Tax=Coraliomargarita sinensis TaxID=2174842 RepID=A0A317ZLC6_9BACT|nr:hypothetical protein [Coraliomargarita sinensis]PXA04629.1 hypothetical protein DDZ13_05505 [Coraliomargarita sinensis]
MSKTDRKLLNVPEGVIDAIKNDLNNNGVKYYKVTDVPEVFIDNHLIHPDVLAKSECVVAALSGCPDDNREYMFLTTLRVDGSDTDLDPIQMVYNTDLQTPEPSGVLRFHGKFPGRTLPIPITGSLQDFQNAVITTGVSFEEAEPRFSNAMHYMAQEYRQHVDGKEYGDE